ncbi:MAG: putative metal-binding protein [Candidatus Methanohalarchaeum thermophilum]|uniref:Metal-binding protein n=1 Tax=Methanohalarchaeum thermophilum TaxID=1903181 RepID=A0A1Q6DTJ1_METT1|nr:MAG: putative metal-binding protein [Candidatus Methanohalarchaeum thermophilum]
MKNEIKENPKNQKVAIIRCEITSETCPGSGCLGSFQEKKKKFKDYHEETKLVGFFTCGGCPGRRISRLIKKLEKSDKKPDFVHLSSCMFYDEEQEYVECPHLDSIKEVIKSKGIGVREGTHH